MEMEQLTDLMQNMLHQHMDDIGVLPSIPISTLGITTSAMAPHTTTPIRVSFIEFGQSELFNYLLPTAIEFFLKYLAFYHYNVNLQIKIKQKVRHRLTFSKLFKNERIKYK